MLDELKKQSLHTSHAMEAAGACAVSKRKKKSFKREMKYEWCIDKWRRVHLIEPK